jgi:hypothetical protein
MKDSEFLIYRKVLQTILHILQIIYQYNGIEGLFTILLSNAIMSNLYANMNPYQIKITHYHIKLI